MTYNHKYFYPEGDVLIMDEAKKERFRWKFYTLTILLNVIVILIACSVVSFFMAPQLLRLPLAIVLLVAAVILAFFFRKKYGETRSWLDENTP